MKTLLGLCLILCAAIAAAAPVPGNTVAPFTLRTPAGVPWHWSPGRVTVFTFCAFWCDTWKTELPRAAASSQALAGLPVDFVAVSVDGRWSDKAEKRPDVIVNDPGSTLTRSLGVDRVPYTLVVGRDGAIAWAGAGTQRSQELIRAIRILATPAPARGEKSVYLTFDDFPAPHLSFELLDRLRALEVPATLFCICSHLQTDPQIVEQLHREGFRPQIHAWEHDRQNLELDRCSKLLATLGFAPPHLYRPPGSEAIFNLDGSRAVHPVDDPYDYTHPGSDEVVRRVLMAVQNGSVIQLHAGVQDTLDALPEIVKNLKGRGFVFRNLDNP